MEDLDIGTAKEKVVSDDHFWGDKLEEGIDAEVNYSKGVLVGGIAPLKMMIGTEEERGMGVSLIYSQKGSVIGLVDWMITRVIDL